MFKICLNHAAHSLLIQLKKMVHLHGDVLTIYTTLLKKIPKYDDITALASRTQTRVLRLEDLFNSLLGRSLAGNSHLWDAKLYDHHTRIACILCIKLALDVFSQVTGCLNCIEMFFQNYDNLSKLLIPCFLAQAESINVVLGRLLELFRIQTIVDNIELIKNITPATLIQLRKVERITTGIEQELEILFEAFMTYDRLLEQYTAILLGKTILKMDIDVGSCSTVKRRDICFLAAEKVINIPLRQDQLGESQQDQLLYYGILIMVLVLLLMAMVLWTRFWAGY